MADMAKQITIDYTLLTDAVKDLKALGPYIHRISSIGSTRGRGYALPTATGTVANGVREVGNGGFGRALANFYLQWETPMSDASSGISNLESTFQATADAFMDADAKQAATINEGAAMAAVIGYPAEMQAYYQALESFGEQNPYTGQFVSTGKMPDMPIPPGNPYSLASGVTTTYDNGTQDPHPPEPNYSWPQNLPTTETTTVVNDGLTYTETTTFGPDKGWGPDGPTQDTTQVIKHADGTTETVTMVANLDGSVSEKDVTVSGNTTTTTTAYRSGWDPSTWTDTTPVTPDGDSTTTGPDLGAPMVN